MSDDYRSMYDAKYIGAWDLPANKDVIVVIDRVEASVLTSSRGTNKKPVVFFRGKEKGLVLNKTNGNAIAGMYGTRTSKWKGQPIAIYATTTSVGGETVDCVRVRPRIPTNAPKKDSPAPEPEPTAEEEDIHVETH